LEAVLGWDSGWIAAPGADVIPENAMTENLGDAMMTDLGALMSMELVGMRLEVYYKK
jgi:hypothetical protein